MTKKMKGALKFRPIWPPERRTVGSIVIDKLLDGGNKDDKHPLLTVQDHDGTIWQYRAPDKVMEQWSTQAVRVEIVSPADAGAVKEPGEDEGAT